MYLILFLLSVCRWNPRGLAQVSPPCGHIRQTRRSSRQVRAAPANMKPKHQHEGKNQRESQSQRHREHSHRSFLEWRVQWVQKTSKTRRTQAGKAAQLGHFPPSVWDVSVPPCEQTLRTAVSFLMSVTGLLTVMCYSQLQQLESSQIPLMLSSCVCLSLHVEEIIHDMLM